RHGDVAERLFAQRVVEMHEVRVDEILGDVVAEAADRRQALQDKPDMQGQKLESSVDPVRGLEGEIEFWPAGRGRDLAPKLGDHGEARAPGAPSGENQRKRRLP